MKKLASPLLWSSAVAARARNAALIVIPALISLQTILMNMHDNFASATSQQQMTMQFILSGISRKTVKIGILLKILELLLRTERIRDICFTTRILSD